MLAPLGMLAQEQKKKDSPYVNHRGNSDFDYALPPLDNPRFSVLHFSTYHKCAGQSVAANRLCKGLYAQNVRSDMVVSPEKAGGNLPPNVHRVQFEKGPFGMVAERRTLYEYPRRLFGIGDNFHTGLIGIDVAQEVAAYDPDIVQLHFINDGFVRLEDLPAIDKPMVWRLSDCWAFTGGCHFANRCDKYGEGCGKCYILNSSIDPDISGEVWRRKKEVYDKLVGKITFVTPAKWLYDKCRRSPLLAGHDIRHIPNGLNTTTDYYPEDKAAAREALGLPLDKKVVLFGAEDAKSKRKGLAYLKNALSTLTDKGSYHFVAFGHLALSDMAGTGVASTCFGPVYQTDVLRRLYSAADVFVCPSLVEPFGQVVTEAMACGTPVVAFENTGPGTIIEHRRTGYVAGYLKADELAEGIRYCVGNDMTAAARKTAVDIYDIDKVVLQYVELYDNILSK